MRTRPRFQRGSVSPIVATTSVVLPTLAELSLSATSFTLAVTSTANISGTTTGSTLSATGLPAGLTLDSAARTLSWSGVGTLGSSSFLLTESLVVSGTTITRQTTINYSITVTLVALSLSATSFVNGTSSSGTIIGAKTGSTITGSGLPTGFTINSAARTWAFDGTGGISTGTLTLIETLAGATNTPLPTLINYTISAPATITTPVLTQTSTAGTAQTKFQFSFTVAAGPDGSQNLVGLYSETAVTNVSAVAPGWSDSNGIGLNFNVGSASLGFYKNGGTPAATTTLGSVVAVGDEFTIEVDISGSAGSHVIKCYRGSSNTPVLSTNTQTLTGFLTAYFSVKDGVGVTANFGASTFTHPLNSGFNIYG
jgi:hypothetical protein